MKKKKKKKRGMFRFIVVLLLIVVFVLLFQTRSIKVKGNEYYGENSIISWLEKDKLSMNTVYLFGNIIIQMQKFRQLWKK